jgi:hypothetical protein
LHIERVQRQQLAHTGLFAGNHREFVAVILADHPQAPGQRQHEQEEQHLELARETEPSKQADTR